MNEQPKQLKKNLKNSGLNFFLRADVTGQKLIHVKIFNL